jgi:hypothetical protein
MAQEVIGAHEFSALKSWRNDPKSGDDAKKRILQTHQLTREPFINGFNYVILVGKSSVDTLRKIGVPWCAVWEGYGFRVYEVNVLATSSLGECFDGCRNCE